MQSTALESHNSRLTSRGNLHSVSSDLREHARHVENPAPAVVPPPATPLFHRAVVDFSTSAKNFCYVKISDGRRAFLHRDDFEGSWPPQKLHTVLFTTLIRNHHPRCEWRIKDACLPGAQ